MGPRWRRWKRSFEFFLEAKGITKDLQRKALLLHCAGQDVQDIFDTLADPKPVSEHDTAYAKAMRSLVAHFLPQVNVPFERHQFRQAKQEDSETADQFVTRLFQLAETCDFGTTKEEQIRDQLIDKCRSHDLRKKLLAVTSGKLTLQKARDIARSMEAAESQARLIESDSKSENVNVLEDLHSGSRRRKKENCYRCGLVGHFANDPECKARPARRGNCYRCGPEGHFSSDPECKARLATCMKCKKVGHLAKVCKTKGEDRSKKGDIRQVSEDDEFAFTVQTCGR